MRLRRILVIVLSLGLLGMGGFGGGREPGLPAREFHATFVDVDGNRVEVNRATAGGDASLEGELGRGRLRIPFDNIASIRFAPLKDDRDHVRAEVQLREGQPIVVTVRGTTTFYGQTPGGAFQIRARDLKAVDFAS